MKLTFHDFISDVFVYSCNNSCEQDQFHANSFGPLKWQYIILSSWKSSSMPFCVMPFGTIFPCYLLDIIQIFRGLLTWVVMPYDNYNSQMTLPLTKKVKCLKWLMELTISCFTTRRLQPNPSKSQFIVYYHRITQNWHRINKKKKCISRSKHFRKLTYNNAKINKKGNNKQ